MTVKREESPGLPQGDQPVTRKDALMKAGRYAAFTAAVMLMILDPVKGGDRPPSVSPKPPRGGSTQKSARRKKRTDPPPSY